MSFSNNSVKAGQRYGFYNTNSIATVTVVNVSGRKIDYVFDHSLEDTHTKDQLAFEAITYPITTTNASKGIPASVLHALLGSK